MTVFFTGAGVALIHVTPRYLSCQSLGVDILSATVTQSLKCSALLPLARTLATRDMATFEHARRVRRYATALALRLGLVENGLLRTIEVAALFHDVGKLAIADNLLAKRAPLTPEEYEQVKRHAEIGADLLDGLSLPGPVGTLVRHHHENWDGTGYPDRLRGVAIPAGARALAIADCYDALTSDRPYRRAMSHTTAVAMMSERRGSMFDPVMLEVFLPVAESLRPVSACAPSSWQHAIINQLQIETTTR
jgi:putative two-component system response regulator